MTLRLFLHLLSSAVNTDNYFTLLFINNYSLHQRDGE